MRYQKKLFEAGPSIFGQQLIGFSGILNFQQVAFPVKKELFFSDIMCLLRFEMIVTSYTFLLMSFFGLKDQTDPEFSHVGDVLFCNLLQSQS